MTAQHYSPSYLSSFCDFFFEWVKIPLVSPQSSKYMMDIGKGTHATLFSWTKPHVLLLLTKHLQVGALTFCQPAACALKCVLLQMNGCLLSQQWAVTAIPGKISPDLFLCLQDLTVIS